MFNFKSMSKEAKEAFQLMALVLIPVTIMIVIARQIDINNAE